MVVIFLPPKSGRICYIYYSLYNKRQKNDAQNILSYDLAHEQLFVYRIVQHGYLLRSVQDE